MIGGSGNRLAEDRADKIEPRHRCHHVDGYGAVFDTCLPDLSSMISQHRVGPDRAFIDVQRGPWANVTFKQARLEGCCRV